MQAINVKYMPATNTKPTRVKATAGRQSLILSTSSHDEPEQAAALALARRLGWTGSLVSGVQPNGDTVFCFVESHGHKQPVFTI